MRMRVYVGDVAAPASTNVVPSLSLSLCVCVYVRACVCVVCVKATTSTEAPILFTSAIHQKLIILAVGVVGRCEP